MGGETANRQVIMDSFGFESCEVVGLAKVTPGNEIQHSSLKELAHFFDWRLKKESRVARPNWRASDLYMEQI